MSDVTAQAPSGEVEDFAVALYRSRDEAIDPEIASLLRVDRLAQFTVEMTTSCNLACVYCHFAPLDRRGKDLAGDLPGQEEEAVLPGEGGDDDPEDHHQDVAEGDAEEQGEGAAQALRTAVAQEDDLQHPADEDGEPDRHRLV